MRLIVFGSTGGTGRQLIQQALAAGHIVTAIARNPSALTFQNRSLSIINGDVLQLPSFEAAMQQQDAVLSALGFRSAKDVNVYSQGVINIITAMNRYGVKRIICVSAAAAETNPTLSPVYRLLTKLLQSILKETYADVLRMEKQLRATNLEWTIVRPPRLTNGRMKSKYRFSINEWLKHCTAISRADLAHFMLEHINDRNTFQSISEIAY